MEEIKYIVGKYYPKKGGYYHICPVCGEDFFGRENKVYCNDKCRYHTNNLIAKSGRCYTKKENNILKTNSLVLKSLYPISKGIKPIDISKLGRTNFDGAGPFRLEKDPITGKDIHWHHSYGIKYTEKNSEIIILKKDENN
ncbi:MAG: hypothetical protein A3K10_09865 [Bacteroidetes bacterium RIFCSPLOWO2_12_FULL_31_6]|nr:MAG: hypothetical protein A3K10_09865 [Bacteroidetes bacterium RIFCSPLOWO2_12_FULL_31_6]